MLVEGHAAHCFSHRHVVKLDDRPFGEYFTRWFGEGVDIRLLERQRLYLRKESWWPSRFVLRDGEGNVLAKAKAAGMLTNAWDLTLGTGPASLVPAGWLSSAYTVRQDGQAIAEVDSMGCCGQWHVMTKGGNSPTDLLFVGLIYQTILERRRSAD